MITDFAVCLRPARLWFWGCLCLYVKTEPNTAIWTQCKCCLSYYNVVYYKVLQPLASPHHWSQLLSTLFSTLSITVEPCLSKTHTSQSLSVILTHIMSKTCSDARAENIFCIILYNYRNTALRLIWSCSISVLDVTFFWFFMGLMSDSNINLY